MAIRGGCGDLFPGNQPIDPYVSSIVIPVYIPSNPIISNPIDPVGPVIGGSSGGGGGRGGPGPGRGGPVNQAPKWKCVVPGQCSLCDGAPGNPLPTDPNCVYSDQATCIANCQPLQIKYKCQDIYEYCPPPKSNVRFLARRQCLPCDGQPGNPQPSDPSCRFNDLASCQQGCAAVTPDTRECVSQIKYNIPQVSNNSDPIIVQTAQVYNETQLSTNTYQPQVQVNVQNSNVVLSTQTVLPSLNLNNNLYHPKYNFFSLETINDSYTYYVKHNFNSNIFSPRIASELNDLLVCLKNKEPWNENLVAALTLNKIYVSLNPNLITTFNAIRHINGEKVNIESFLNMLKKHILTDTLDEFDGNYFYELAERQNTENYVVLTNVASTESNEITSITKLIANGVRADTRYSENSLSKNLRRQRRLNEDINTRTCACTLEGDVKELLIPNAGICVLTQSNGSFNIENSPGDGYYLYLNTVDSGCIPYSYDTDVSAALIAPPQVRYEALRISDINPNLFLTCRSTSSSHEFLPGDNPQTNLESMYFKLNLESVTSVEDSNLLIDTTNATYTLITNEDEIKEHTGNNGFAVSRVNIDYRDPIFRYAQETSSISATQTDLSFRRFNSRLNLDPILTRNLPFGLVLVPVRGSRHNPFNGRSVIKNFDNFVERSIELTYSLDHLKEQRLSTRALNSVLLAKSNETRVGIAEPVDTEAVSYVFDKNSEFFVNNMYNSIDYFSSVNQVSSYGASYLIKDVLDYVKTYHNTSSLYWFDVFRRLPLNRFGELMYDCTPDLMVKLGNGYRDNIKIKNLLNREDLEDDLLEDDPIVVITKNDRI